MDFLNIYIPPKPEKLVPLLIPKSLAEKFTEEVIVQLLHRTNTDIFQRKEKERDLQDKIRQAKNGA